jgi:hypothetical protein
VIALRNHLAGAYAEIVALFGEIETEFSDGLDGLEFCIEALDDIIDPSGDAILNAQLLEDEGQR